MSSATQSVLQIPRSTAQCTPVLPAFKHTYSQLPPALNEPVMYPQHSTVEQISSKDSACCQPACNSGPHSLTGILPHAALHVHRSAHPSYPFEVSSLCMNSSLCIHSSSFLKDAPRQFTWLGVDFCDPQLTGRSQFCTKISVEPLSSVLITHGPHLLGLFELHLRSCNRHLCWNIVSPSSCKAIHRNVEVWVVPQIRCRVLHPVPQRFWSCFVLQSMRETCLLLRMQNRRRQAMRTKAIVQEDNSKWGDFVGVVGGFSRRMTDSSSTDGT